ncbi:radical SAM protein [Halobacteriovorax sp. GB3]|uniref:radical SAM protein n=1 Tax=Halobacteriovorax sp. GB3 TaxID=2719615 RepID=UPI0023630851|nr:radical SAM protein [Halobacteriovorax sp. GB3]MDD0854361.1 radical SAM protein [Halobacteriovorax sp. GB3]
MKINQKEITQVGHGSPMIINWELVSHCQFKCSYCYYDPFESNTDYESLQKIIQKKISNIDQPFVINLIGGEPTLHPNFSKIVSFLQDLEKCTEIRIVTNLAKPIHFWDSISSTKIVLTASYHPEYDNGKFFEKINQLYEKFDSDVPFLVPNSLIHLPRMKKTLENLLNIDSPRSPTINIIRPHYKSGYSVSFEQYPEEIELFIKEATTIISKNENQEKIKVYSKNKEIEMAKSTFFDLNMHYLKGWKCNINAFIIHYNGYVSSACRNDKKHIITAKFKSTPLICPYQACECDDFWNFEKYRNANE